MAKTALKIGQTAVMRTTGEPVFILDIRDITLATTNGYILNPEKFDMQEAVVRRPHITENGAVTHLVEVFVLEELESPEDRTQREMADIFGAREQAKGMLLPTPGKSGPLS